MFERVSLPTILILLTFNKAMKTDTGNIDKKYTFYPKLKKVCY